MGQHCHLFLHQSRSQLVAALRFWLMRVHHDSDGAAWLRRAYWERGWLRFAFFSDASSRGRAEDVNLPSSRNRWRSLVAQSLLGNGGGCDLCFSQMRLCVVGQGM